MHEREVVQIYLAYYPERRELKNGHICTPRGIKMWKDELGSIDRIDGYIYGA